MRPPYSQQQPSIHLVPSQLEALGLAACADRPVPSGMSIQWSAPPSTSRSFWQQLPGQSTEQVPTGGSTYWRQGQHEVTLGVSGLKAGAPKRTVTLKFFNRCFLGSVLISILLHDPFPHSISGHMMLSNLWTPSSRKFVLKGSCESHICCITLFLSHFQTI